MAMTPEGKVKADIKVLLKRLGIFYFMPATGGFGASGIHDFVLCWKGMFIAIEAKAPGKEGTRTPMQLRADEAVRAAGGLSLVVSSVSALDLALTNFMSEAFE